MYEAVPVSVPVSVWKCAVVFRLVPNVEESLLKVELSYPKKPEMLILSGVPDVLKMFTLFSEVTVFAAAVRAAEPDADE